MGNQLGSTNQSRIFNDNTLKDFEYATIFVEDINDKCFGDVRIFKRRDTLHRSLFIMEKSNNNDQKLEFAQLYAESQARLQLQHPNLLPFLGFDFVNAKDLCSSQMRSRLFFEYYYHDLSKEIERRSQSKVRAFTQFNVLNLFNKQEYFPEDEVWYILKSLVDVCAFLQENQLFHGDLRPQSVKLSPEGFVKIGDHGLINPLKNGFYKTLIRVDNAYLSPSQLSYLMQGLNEIKYNSFKQDVFTLGLTILECLTLMDVSQIFDWDRMMIQQETLKQLIASASLMYSPELIAIINLMLEFDDSYRPDFIQLRMHVKNEEQNLATAQQNQNDPNSPSIPFNPKQQVESRLTGAPSQSHNFRLTQSNPPDIISQNQQIQQQIPQDMLSSQSNIQTFNQYQDSQFMPQQNQSYQYQNQQQLQQLQQQMQKSQQYASQVAPFQSQPLMISQGINQQQLKPMSAPFIQPGQTFMQYQYLTPSPVQQQVVSTSMISQQPPQINGFNSVGYSMPTAIPNQFLGGTKTIINQIPPQRVILQQQPEMSGTVYLPNTNCMQPSVIMQKRPSIHSVQQIQHIQPVILSGVHQPQSVYQSYIGTNVSAINNQQLSPYPPLFTSPAQIHGYSQPEYCTEATSYDNINEINTNQNTHARSVKFMQSPEPQSDLQKEQEYQPQTVNPQERSTLKRSEIQFNTDLDRRVSEALEMTRMTIRKNQSVPNIFQDNSPLKRDDHQF